jgi:NADH dehydrogenase [ubiquinone] 1 alpha subcomplex assembly factor 1
MSRFLALALAAAPLLFIVQAGSTPAAAQSAGTQATGAPAAEETDVSPKVLFDFEGTGTAQWRVESDRVMGGRSTGSAEVAEGMLVFTGEVVTEGGGFSSVRAGRQVDLSGYDGIELRVRGGGRTFALDVSDGTESRGREVTRRAPFPTTGSWETVRVPFDALEETAHGEPVSPGPLNRSAVTSIGIYIIDGKDGPFRLEVDWIRSYREEE